jgi:hypothetical protein
MKIPFRLTLLIVSRTMAKVYFVGLSLFWSPKSGDFGAKLGDFVLQAKIMF